MKTKLILAAALVSGTLGSVAFAQDSTVTGAAGGAVTGAIVGGPVGAAVGGVVGAVAGTAIDPPPQRVVTYVQQQPVQQSVVVKQPIVVGKPVPQEVVLTPIADDPRYSYTVVNEQRVIVDPQTRTVVQVIQ
ncbi:MULTISPECIES: DUF1236 domain-containing protein [unclassified Rhizobium]|uniref:DUF1236 domain-containing protein n=1 Tax=unclassified Rhizobium TaxID=2613769 RepID=UPI000713F80B|nr:MULTISPECIES: DUF1236 domain-containing protein [unclassified Rhizobium]KQS87446.1 hypothetical protein ASG50_28360 [Rhizobium sp. Leaf386]KQT00529.1 hypothetical protein ASG42_03830 [Rhizobium sp. Leaf391]KQT97531.1 hypothetical protein ASG68_08560 [Rhizobium sp. Leaf453]